MSITILQIFEKDFETNTKTLETNVKLSEKSFMKYIVLDNTEGNEILSKVRNIQKKSKFEYIKKDFTTRTENILNILNLIETEKILFMYEFDLLPENFATQNFLASDSSISIFQKLNLDIIKNNKISKFYKNNYVFIFDTLLLKEILEQINTNTKCIKNWSIEVFYFYILEQKIKMDKKNIENKYLINCLDFESFNNKEIFLSKKHKKEYLKLKFKYSKNMFEKMKIIFRNF